MNSFKNDTFANQAFSANTAEKEEYITTREAANILGVTVRTIQNWVDSGKLHARVTLGGHRRLPRSAVDALAYQNTPDETSRSVARKTPPRTKKPASGEVLRVLVVEDNAQLLDLYKLKFSTFSFPHELLTAEDGVQGIFKVGRYSPHLLLMDLHMPNMNGFQMLRALQSMPEITELKIIVLTGLQAADILEGGGLPSGVALLPKPVPFETLEALCMQRITELG